MDYTQLFNLFKEIAMEYGIWSSAVALSLAVTLPVLVWRLPEIIRAWRGR